MAVLSSFPLLLVAGAARIDGLRTRRLAQLVLTFRLVRPLEGSCHRAFKLLGVVELRRNFRRFESRVHWGDFISELTEPLQGLIATPGFDFTRHFFLHLVVGI